MNKKETIALKGACLLFVFAIASIAQDVINTITPPAAIFEALALNRDIGTKKKPKYRSPAALVPSLDKTKMYIADQSEKKITEYDLVNKAVLRRFDMPNEVTGIVLTPDGKTLYATCASDQWPLGVVCVVDVATGKITKQIKDIGYFPRNPLVTPDGQKVYAFNMFSDDLVVISTATNEIIKRVEVIREPYSAAISPNGKRIVIGNSLPNDRSTDSEFVSCEITIYDTESDDTLTNFRLTRGSHSVYGMAVSPDNKYAIATHLIGKFNLLVSTVASGWIHTNNVAVIDIEKEELVNDVSLDFALRGLANPWEVKFTAEGVFPPDSTFMVVAHAGANSLSMILWKPFVEMVSKFAAMDSSLAQQFTAITDDMRKVVDIKTKGTRTLAIIDRIAYTAGFYDDENAVMEGHAITVSTRRGTFPNPQTHVIGAPKAKTAERKGELIYYDGDLCMQEWQSCHSCHPFTRPDALNWILNSGAAGSPKNAKSMLYAWWTPPTGWDGRREHAQASIISGIQLELFQQPDQKMTLPLDTFFMYLKPVPSPHLVKGRLSEAAQRGKALYYDSSKVDCIKCHKGPLFHDDRMYVILDDPFDNRSMNTPQLNECWRTAPYGHLGRYTGMKEILELDNHSNMRQNVVNGILKREDVDDLVEYILSL